MQKNLPKNKSAIGIHQRENPEDEKEPPAFGYYVLYLARMHSIWLVGAQR